MSSLANWRSEAWARFVNKIQLKNKKKRPNVLFYKRLIQSYERIPSVWNESITKRVLFIKEDSVVTILFIYIFVSSKDLKYFFNF